MTSPAPISASTMVSKPPSLHSDSEKAEPDTKSVPCDKAQDDEAKLEEHYKQLSTSRVALLFGCVFVNMFLVALDRMIITTVHFN